MRPRRTVPPHALTHAWRRRVGERVAAVEHGPGVAPLVDADPAADSPVRVWRMTDGRLRWRDGGGAVHEAAEAAPGPSTSVPSLPDVDQVPMTYTATWTAVWVASFGAGAPVAGSYGDGVRCMVGFGAQPSADLAGAQEITAVRVWFYNLEGGADEVRLGVGWHSADAQPGTYSGSAPLSRVDVPRIGSPGWVRVSRSIGGEFVSGGARGLVVDQVATGDAAGRLAIDTGRAPRLQITYRA